MKLAENSSLALQPCMQDYIFTFNHLSIYYSSIYLTWKLKFQSTVYFCREDGWKVEVKIYQKTAELIEKYKIDVEKAISALLEEMKRIYS